MGPKSGLFLGNEEKPSRILQNNVDIFEKVRLEVNLELERTNGRISHSFFQALAQKYEEKKDIVCDIRDLFVKLEVEKDRADC